MSGENPGTLEAALDMIRRSQEDIPMAPAMVSWVRIILLPLCVWCGWESNFTGMFWLCLIAASSDYFDGWTARRLKLSSTPGKTLDMLADKLFLSVMLILLSRTGIIEPVLLLIPAWYHIGVVLGLLIVSWSIRIPVVAITTSERLTIILSYILVVTTAGALAFQGKAFRQDQLHCLVVHPGCGTPWNGELLQAFQKTDTEVHEMTALLIFLLAGSSALELENRGLLPRPEPPGRRRMTSAARHE